MNVQLMILRCLVSCVLGSSVCSCVQDALLYATAFLFHRVIYENHLTVLKQGVLNSLNSLQKMWVSNIKCIPYNISISFTPYCQVSVCKWRRRPVVPYHMTQDNDDVDSRCRTFNNWYSSSPTNAKICSVSRVSIGRKRVHLRKTVVNIMQILPDVLFESHVTAPEL